MSISGPVTASVAAAEGKHRAGSTPVVVAVGKIRRDGLASLLRLDGVYTVAAAVDTLVVAPVGLLYGCTRVSKALLIAKDLLTCWLLPPTTLSLPPPKMLVGCCGDWSAVSPSSPYRYT